MSPRAAGLLLSVLAVLAPPRRRGRAEPPAPGAPGARHTWAPADKHGFGTAHQLAGHAYFTLRQASLSEVYYPDLSTPAFRGLQFAVTDGKSFVDREVVDDDPRHIEPVAPGVTASVTPLDRSLALPPGDRERPLAADQDLDHRPRARQRAAAACASRPRPGRRCGCSCSPTAAPGNDGNDDRGISGESTLVAYDDEAASAVAASPALAQTSSGYRGTASDPWRDLQDYKLERTDATQPGNVVQGARAALDGKDNQTMTLAIGFGRDATAATARRRRARSRAASTPRKAAYDSGWSAYLASLKAPPAPVAGNAQMKRLYEQSLLVLAGARGQDPPRRLDRRAEHAVDLGHAHARRRQGDLRPLPPRLAARLLPRRHRAEGGRRRRRREPARRLPVGGPEGREQARSGRTPASTARRSGRASSSTRRRCPSCSPGGWAARPPRTGTTSAPPPTT